MDNISVLEETYKKYIKNLNDWLPEGIVDVNLTLLYEFDLLDYKAPPGGQNDGLTRYFHVIETDEKITLVNEDFVVWIVPEALAELPTTHTLIALNTPSHPKLEVVFSTKGVYNSSNLVLRILEKFLMEIQENEELISKMNGTENNK